jgi:hypothetical protein
MNRSSNVFFGLLCSLITIATFGMGFIHAEDVGKRWGSRA